MFVWALIVGLSFPAVGLLSEGLPPLFLTAIRFVIAALALGPLIRRAPDRWPSIPGLMLYAVMGLCLAGFFGAMFWAAHQLPAVSMATLYVSVPMIAYLFGRVLGVERPDIRLLAMLLLGAVGALSLAWVGNAGTGDRLDFGQAEALFMVGCAATALYPVMSKWGMQRGFLSNSAAVRTFWSLVAGATLVGLLALVVEPVQAMARMTLVDFLLVAYLGVFSSGVTFWLLQRGTAALTPGTVTSYTYLIPFASLVIAFITESENLGWHWLPGSGAVILAMILLLRRSPSMHLKASTEVTEP
jgi:drug/metabolite transporter (DMT)-like permease